MGYSLAFVFLVNFPITFNVTTLSQIEKHLGTLKPDFDSFPDLSNKAESTTKEIYLLKRVNFELSETSKDMRNKVLPHARFIINDILSL
jgi:hypothetical protein